VHGVPIAQQESLQPDVSAERVMHRCPPGLTKVVPTPASPVADRYASDGSRDGLSEGGGHGVGAALTAGGFVVHEHKVHSLLGTQPSALHLSGVKG